MLQFGVREDPTIIKNFKVVSFSKLQPRTSSVIRSAGEDAVNNVGKAIDKIKNSRSSGLQFDKMISRSAMQDPESPSLYMSYPLADKPKKHSPAVDLSRSQGHGSLVQHGQEWSSVQDKRGRMPLSNTGSKVRSSPPSQHHLTTVWHSRLALLYSGFD